MNRYELTYIIDTGLEETARKELIEKISQLIAANGGEVEKVDETWGKRRLAYAINYKTEGWYVLVTLKAPSALPREIERNLGNMEAILRYLFVKLEEKRSNVKPRPVRVAPAVETAAEAAPAAETASTLMSDSAFSDEARTWGADAAQVDKLVDVKASAQADAMRLSFGALGLLMAAGLLTTRHLVETAAPRAEQDKAKARQSH